MFNSNEKDTNPFAGTHPGMYMCQEPKFLLSSASESRRNADRKHGHVLVGPWTECAHGRGTGWGK